MLLYDTEANRIVSSLNTTIYPAGWVMSSEAEAVNGLSTQYLQDTGVPSQSVIPLFMPITSKADLVVGHNAGFDIKIMSAALWRHIVEEHGDNFANADVFLRTVCERETALMNQWFAADAPCRA